MATLTGAPKAESVEAYAPRLRLFNVTEFEALFQVGIFSKCRHIELIGGEILPLSPDSHPQCFTEDMIAALPDTWFPTRYRFTVDEYMKMAEVGIIAEGERVELIDGDVIEMSPIGNPHEARTAAGNRLLAPLFIEGRAVLRVQGHVRLDENNRPEPDLALLKWRDDLYASRSPAPEDILLLIEVSDSTLASDRNRKLALYAHFGVPEVWIANIPTRVVETYRDPVDGEYTNSRVYSPGEMVSPAAFDDVEIPVSRFIGAMSDEREDNRPESG